MRSARADPTRSCLKHAPHCNASAATSAARNGPIKRDSTIGNSREKPRAQSETPVNPASAAAKPREHASAALPRDAWRASANHDSHRRLGELERPGRERATTNIALSGLTPELSRADLRPRHKLKIQKCAEAAKRSRLERIVSCLLEACFQREDRRTVVCADQ